MNEQPVIQVENFSGHTPLKGIRREKTEWQQLTRRYLSWETMNLIFSRIAEKRYELSIATEACTEESCLYQHFSLTVITSNMMLPALLICTFVANQPHLRGCYAKVQHSMSKFHVWCFYLYGARYRFAVVVLLPPGTLQYLRPHSAGRSV
jgi:hypothetical protein